MESDPLIVSSLVKSFGSRVVVNDLSFHVDAGEVLGLLGPNGVGKSTTMRICAGVVEPTAGTVRVCGADPTTDVVAARARLGYVPDVGGLFPRLTGWEHLELAAKLRDLGNDWPERAVELLKMMELADVAGQRASTYSHGMSRKLSVAIAVLGHPKVLLLDEPFDGVDPAGSLVVRELISQAAAEGTAVVISTHLLDVASKVCDRLSIVSEGTVVAAGTVDEIVTGHHADSLEDAYLQVLGVKPAIT